jgi:hypothetical protein
VTSSLVHILLVACALPIAGAAASEMHAASETHSMKAECYERGVLLDSLAEDHGERLTQTRRVGASGLLEAFKSATDGTWTIVFSNDDRISCVLATGEGLETSDGDTATVAAAPDEFTI